MEQSIKSKTQHCSLKECKKKLKIVDMKCRCEMRFCGIHRLPETHNCDYDFKKKGREDLRKSFETKKSNVNLNNTGNAGNAY